jgi:hypothetical protein
VPDFLSNLQIITKNKSTLFKSPKNGGKVLDMKDFHQKLVDNTKEENFLGCGYIYQACRESDKLPGL